MTDLSIRSCTRRRLISPRQRHGTERAILRRRSPCGGVETPSTTIMPSITHPELFPLSILAFSFSRHEIMSEKASFPAACHIRKKKAKLDHLVCDRCTKKEKLHCMASTRRSQILTGDLLFPAQVATFLWYEKGFQWSHADTSVHPGYRHPKRTPSVPGLRNHASMCLRDVDNRLKALNGCGVGAFGLM